MVTQYDRTMSGDGRGNGRDDRKPWQPPAPVDGPAIPAENLLGNVLGAGIPSQLVISNREGITLATIAVDSQGVLHVTYDPDQATEAASQFFDSLRVMFGKTGAQSAQGQAWA